MKRKRSRPRKWLWRLLILLLLGGGVGAYLLFSSGEKPVPVQSGEVAKGELSQIVSASGRVNPEVQVEISANISAEIRAIHVREGEEVAKGQTLVSLDSQRYQANSQQTDAGLKAARAQERQAEAQLALAQKNFERKKQLSTESHITKEALDAAETELTVARANLDTARFQVNQAQAGSRISGDELSKTTIVSPIAGVVTRLIKEEGEIALGSTFARDVIMEISDMTKIVATVDVDEADVVRVTIGDRATVEIDALPDTKFEGEVMEIAGSATVSQLGTQQETVSFEVKVLLKGDTSAIRPGLSATADIITETKDDVFQVKIQCLTMRDPDQEITASEDKSSAKEKDDTGPAIIGDLSKMKNVLFAIENERIKPVWIETGISSDTHIEITGEELAEGMQIVCGPFKTLNRQLQPGDLVEVKSESEIERLTKK